MSATPSDTRLREEQERAKMDTHLKLPAEIGTDYTFKRKWVWLNIIGFCLLHLCALYGFFMCFYARFYTSIWMWWLLFVSGEGVTIGAHRYYTHRSFKATKFLRFWLLVLHTMAGQNCMYIWVRDHRQHHKYSDTDADPHNSHRGFFFSHMGWLLSKKHPAVISKGKTIDLSDLEADYMVMFQKEFYKPLYTIFAIMLPVMVPVYFWNESYLNSLFISYFARYILSLHITWLVNSAAHFYGTKPYDRNLGAVESKWVSYMTVGEGWHNYHHAFPWDYRAAEYGTLRSITTSLIDYLVRLGLAYDAKTTPGSMIEHRVFRTGDGTHQLHIHRKKVNNANIDTISETRVENKFDSDLGTLTKRTSVIQG